MIGDREDEESEDNEDNVEDDGDNDDDETMAHTVSQTGATDTEAVDVVPADSDSVARDSYGVVESIQRTDSVTDSDI